MTRYQHLGLKQKLYTETNSFKEDEGKNKVLQLLTSSSTFVYVN